MFNYSAIIFSFAQWLLRYGFKALFSYISWQVPASMFDRLQSLTFTAILVLLVLNIYL